MTTMVSMSLRNARVTADGAPAPLVTVAKFAGIQLQMAVPMPPAQRNVKDARQGEIVVMRASIRCGAL
jgi:hypothetical protein